MQRNNGKGWVGQLCAIGSALILVLCLAAQAGRQGQSAAERDSVEMKKLFDEDQADREINMAALTPEQRLEWINKVGPRDGQRRKQVMELVSRGALHTGDDFDRAAFVFQHGDATDDFLLAHTLATVAVAKGSARSRWIAAATLDRYLQRMQQPQIYGTQYNIGPKQGDQFTQEPYNRQLVPDSLRAAMCVPDQPSQQEVVDLLRQGKEPHSQKKPPGC